MECFYEKIYLIIFIFLVGTRLARGGILSCSVGTDDDDPPVNPFTGKTFYGSQTIEDAKYDVCELKFTSETDVTLVLYGKGADGADKTELLKYTVSDGKASVTYNGKTIETSAIVDNTFTASLDGTDATKYSFSTTKGAKFPTTTPSDPNTPSNPDTPTDPDTPAANPFTGKTFYGSQTIEDAKYDVCELKFTSETDVTLVLYGKGADGADKTEALKYTVSDGKASVTYNGKTIETSAIADNTFTASLDGSEEKKCSFSITKGNRYSADEPDYSDWLTVENGIVTKCDTAAAGAIKIPNGVMSIGYSAFYNCSNMESVIIPDSVTSIESFAFAGCSSLTSVTIPDSVESIGSSAFAGCSSLKSVIIPDSVTSIESFAFAGCSSLTSVTIPDSVESIGSSAFAGCSSLTSVTIPDGVTSIESDAFYDCSSLESITIPDSVKFIGNATFRNCSSLKSVTIPDSVESIGSSAFLTCSSLESVTIGSGVTSIGTDAFRGCYKLATMTYNGTKEQWAAVEKGSDWHEIGLTQVICSNGETVALDYTGTGA